MKIARTVWGGGKGGDYFKVLPIAPEMGSGYLNPYGLRCHTYEKYVLTLPVTRNNIVQSHYLFYFLVVIIGTLLSYGIFYVHGLVSDIPIDDDIFKSVSLGTFIILNAGAIAYPLLYVFGAEKSDAITIGGACGGLVTYFGLQSVIGYLIEQFPISNLNSSVYVSMLYTIFGVIIYIFSFVISVFIYCKKEF